MPFQGPNFVRTQNFTRDRNAGPPDDTIQAEKVDDEFANVAAGLTTVALAAATADDRARTADAKATTEATAARSDLRGGVDVAYDTLAKLYTWAKSTTDAIRSLAGQAAPAGQMALFFTTAAPSGWLLCNGQAVSRATYAGLFAAIGTTYGGGDGSTTFNLPNCLDEFFRGAGATAVGAKGAQSIQSHTHTASTTVEGAHNHGGATGTGGLHAHDGTTNGGGAHAHNYEDVASNPGGGYGARGSSPETTFTRQGTTTPAADHSHYFVTNASGSHAHVIVSDGAHAHGVTVDAAGSAETRPRFIALLPCIKF